MSCRSPHNLVQAESCLRHRRGWTFIELMAVLALIGIAALIGSLSVYRGKVLSQQLACQDNMRAIQSALQIYWTKNNRTYPPNQGRVPAVPPVVGLLPGR